MDFSPEVRMFGGAKPGVESAATASADEGTSSLEALLIVAAISSPVEPSIRLARIPATSSARSLVK